MKKDRSGFVMICDTICGYCRKGVKSAHGIEAVYMYFNRSGIWGGETTSVLGGHLFLNGCGSHFVFDGFIPKVNQIIRNT